MLINDILKKREPSKLVHFGILGMKWGRRKSGASNGSDHKTNITKKKKAILITALALNVVGSVLIAKYSVNKYNRKVQKELDSKLIEILLKKKISGYLD